MWGDPNDQDLVSVQRMGLSCDNSSQQLQGQLASRSYAEAYLSNCCTTAQRLQLLQA